jgi:hypothetical protein
VLQMESKKIGNFKIKWDESKDPIVYKVFSFTGKFLDEFTSQEEAEKYCNDLRKQKSKGMSR